MKKTIFIDNGKSIEVESFRPYGFDAEYFAVTEDTIFHRINGSSYRYLCPNNTPGEDFTGKKEPQ